MSASFQVMRIDVYHETMLSSTEECGSGGMQQVVGCWLLVVGCWLLGVGCRVLGVGCWVLGVVPLSSLVLISGSAVCAEVEAEAEAEAEAEVEVEVEVEAEGGCHALVIAGIVGMSLSSVDGQSQPMLVDDCPHHELEQGLYSAFHRHMLHCHVS